AAGLVGTDGAVAPEGGGTADSRTIRTGDCDAGATACQGQSKRGACVNGKWQVNECNDPTPICQAGACAAAPSCAAGAVGAGTDCGGLDGGTGTTSCCSTLDVPAGTFNRGNDATKPA